MELYNGHVSYNGTFEYKGKLTGFGMRPTGDTLSPYAVICFGEQDGLHQRSRLSSRLIFHDVKEMGKNKTPIDFTQEAFAYARWKTFNAFQFPHRINPIHLNDIFDMDLPCRKSSPGIPWQPYFKTRGQVMDCYAARNSIRWLWHRVKKGEDVCMPDTKVLYRSHISEAGKPKIRAVYGYPTTVTLAEAQFAVPLIAQFKKLELPYCYKYSMGLGGANKLRTDIKRYKFFTCLDFKGFDKCATNELIEMAFDVLLQNLDFSRYHASGVPDSTRLFREWRKIIEYFKRTPLRFFNGHRVQKDGGIPSGSYFTQMIGSIINYFIITFMYYRQLGRGPDFLTVFGDDSVAADDEKICFGKAIHDVYTYLGYVFNIDKSKFTDRVDDVEYLGFGISGGFPRRPFKKWLESLYYPEHPDMSWDDFASRALGLLYANSGVDQTFDLMCRTVLYHKPFRIKLTRDFQRFLENIGVTIEGMQVTPPSAMDLLFSLLK
ncbi:MAG: RNA-dependent RNA polymerase [Tomato associated partiti-like virus 1]|nr:MAG: RNA-dependent RNA polymerase [Tomato associated partiti-like virus 1]UTQ50834.1 MAG: RNA-dependent RNA polymerase [Tomato associated partiti-like virus 1]UTQ50835.1 MAG: RNA-dependent RNA polymerase [Tomato associated partiti-like virus 1]